MNLQNLIRSAGLIDDVLVRPFNRFSQTVVNKRGKTFIPNFSGRSAVQNQVGSGTPIIRPPANVNSPAYTQGGAQRFAAEYGTRPANIPVTTAKPGWQGNVLGAATTAVGLLGDPFGISEALLGTAGKPNQSRMSLLGGVNTDPLIPTTASNSRNKARRPEGYSSYGTYTVGGIEYDINSGRPTYMPAGSVYPSSSVAPFVPAQGQAPGRGPGPTPQPIPQISPEERAYNEERSRIEQLTAQNPEFQNIGQLRNDLRDQGMAIWQQKYGGTPMGQPGGAVGMYNPLMQQTFGYQTGSAPDQQMGAPTQGPTPNIPQVDQSLNPASPTFIGGEGAPLMDFTKENLTPEMIELYQKQLMEQARRK